MKKGLRRTSKAERKKKREKKIQVRKESTVNKKAQ